MVANLKMNFLFSYQNIFTNKCNSKSYHFVCSYSYNPSAATFYLKAAALDKIFPSVKTIIEI